MPTWCRNIGHAGLELKNDNPHLVDLRFADDTLQCLNLLVMTMLVECLKLVFLLEGFENEGDYYKNSTTTLF